MSLYHLHKATLDEVEGQGYAFSRRTFQGKTFQGVLFLDEDAPVDELKEEDTLVFSGTVYHRRRSGPPRKEETTLPVTVESITETSMGPRLNFVYVEEDEAEAA